MKKITKLFSGILCLLLSTSLLADAQDAKPKTGTSKPKSATGAKKPAATAAAKDGYKKLNGVEYKIINHNAAGKKAKIGDIVEFHIIAIVDTISSEVPGGKKHDTANLGNTYLQQEGKPAVTKVDSVKVAGQWPAILPLLATGDSVLIRVPCENIRNGIPAEQRKTMPSWMKKGNTIYINLKIVTVKLMEVYQKEQKEKQEKTQKEMQDKVAKQAPIDDGLIRDYLTKNNIKAEKTASGLYYSIIQEGTGDLITKGKKLSVNYSGFFLDGKMFDSNTDSSKHHVQPFQLTVGAGGVIQGWEEGVTYMKKGTKAKLFIPSKLGYGPQDRGPIPANSVLVFDMEILEVNDN